MGANLIKPTLEQIEWSEAEIGVIITLDLNIYRDGYKWRQHFCDPIPTKEFEPYLLDTDQWVAAAKSLGAKYAVLVAKHCTGFSLWPTEAHDYSVKNSPYKNGEGDIVADFVASCRKFGLRPGIYCSVSANQYLGVDHGKVIDGDTEKQEKYNEIVLQQLTELWTRYGKWFEIWFDGGVLPVEEGGPDVASLIKRLQPDAVVFQGPVGTKSLIRWVGNERGVAPENCSSLYVSSVQLEEGDIEREGDGSINGEIIWSPAESDFPNRDNSGGGWLWKENGEAGVYPAEYLFERYLTTVGRNTNMLVGMVIDREGRFPIPDEAAFAAGGDMIRKVFGSPLDIERIAPFSVAVSKNETRNVGYFSVGEDIAEGERVQGYIVHGVDADGKEIFTYSGNVIAHKRILELPSEVVRVDLEITECRAEPIIKFMELYPALD